MFATSAVREKVTTCHILLYDNGLQKICSGNNAGFMA
jgi:hypothetical protein